jgi:ATP-dependent DNA helicase RecG
MPLPINVNDLLQGTPVEWERLEFKAGWNPEDVLHTICAFANDFHNLGGGYILIGIAEKDGRPVLPPIGVRPEQLDSIQKELLHLGFNAISPWYHPLAVPLMIEGRHVLVIWVLGGQTRPYKAKRSLAKDSKDYDYYIRKGSSTIRAKGADETELMQEYLRQVGVIQGPAEAPLPLNVGLMMFNPEPWRFFPAMQIDVVWFPKEGPGGNKFSEKVFKGPIPRMTRDALDYIARNLTLRAT